MDLWYRQSFLCFLLWPLSLLYRFIIFLRQAAYSFHILPRKKFDVPVVVVGNITVGGTGKTPVVIWLAKYLMSLGYAPGIVSRGYGGNAKHWPQEVLQNSDPALVGDEPVLIVRKTHCPMVVGPDRVKAVQILLKSYNCDVVISDDGLQHYAMQRDLEIVVVDGLRRFGNRMCLPAGPLREPISRLEHVDFVLVNGEAKSDPYNMFLHSGLIYNLLDADKTLAIDMLSAKKIHAVAGIGNPERFFMSLRHMGLHIIPHAFPDHHVFTAKDIDFGDDAIVVMTEKDAIKCTRLATQNVWCLPVTAEPNQAFVLALRARIDSLIA